MVKIRVPNPMNKWDYLGIPLFSETPMYYPSGRFQSTAFLFEPSRLGVDDPNPNVWPRFVKENVCQPFGRMFKKLVVS